MIYYIKNPELCHYGIKGMKWGVRHDPERVGRRRVNVGKKTANKRRGLSKGQKIALGIAAVAAVAGTGVVLYKTGAFSKLSALGKKAIANNINVKDELSTVGTAKSIADRINPHIEMCNFNSFIAGLPSNLNLSLKSDLNGKYEKGVTEFLNKALKNPEDHIFDTIPPVVYKDKERLSSTILRIAKNTEGASGQISSDLITGGGHAFNWKVENGNVKYFDTLVRHYNSDGKIVTGPLEDASGHISRISGINGKIIRLDNITEDDLHIDYIDTICDHLKK